jgi:nitronate monooxygenase
MPLETDLCRLLKIQYPIIQAPIGSAVSPELVAAVLNAGAFGFHALSWKSPEDIRLYLSKTQALSQHPFGVNLVLAWSQFERLKICLDEGVRVFSFSWGNASEYIKLVHEYDGLAMVAVGSSSEAIQAVSMGADVIVAQSWEAGGHVIGQVAGLSLIPSVVDAVQPIPVLAAGGIADGRGLVAALALGASGVWMGTRFLASTEAIAHQIYKDQLIDAKESDTLYSFLFDGGWENAPHRTIRNSTVVQWEAAISSGRLERPNLGEIIGTAPNGSPIQRYEDAIPLLETKGNLEAMALYAGQSAGLIDKVLPASEIIREIVTEAEAIMSRFAQK